MPNKARAPAASSARAIDVSVNSHRSWGAVFSVAFGSFAVLDVRSFLSFLLNPGLGDDVGFSGSCEAPRVLSVAALLLLCVAPQSLFRLKL